MSPASFYSTILTSFLLPCLRSKSHSPPQPTKTTRQIICNQNGRRFHLSPIMPPTTRHQTRITNDSDSDALMPATKETSPSPSRSRASRSRSRSRKTSVTHSDSAQLEVEWGRRQSRLAFETSRSRKNSVAVELEAEILERRQSKVIFDVVMQKDMEHESRTEAAELRERTCEMEMQEAIHKVKKEDEGI